MDDHLLVLRKFWRGSKSQSTPDLRARTGQWRFTSPDLGRLNSSTWGRCPGSALLTSYLLFGSKPKAADGSVAILIILAMSFGLIVPKLIIDYFSERVTETES